MTIGNITFQSQGVDILSGHKYASEHLSHFLSEVRHDEDGTKVWSRNPRRWKRVQSVEWIQDWPCIANNTWILHPLGPVRHRLCNLDLMLEGPAEANSSSYEPTQRPAAVSLLLLLFPGGLRLGSQKSGDRVSQLGGSLGYLCNPLL